MIPIFVLVLCAILDSMLKGQKRRIIKCNFSIHVTLLQSNASLSTYAKENSNY